METKICLLVPAFLCKSYILVKISWINVYEMLGIQYMMQAEKHLLCPQPCDLTPI